MSGSETSPSSDPLFTCKVTFKVFGYSFEARSRFKIGIRLIVRRFIFLIFGTLHLLLMLLSVSRRTSQRRKEKEQHEQVEIKNITQ